MPGSYYLFFLGQTADIYSDIKGKVKKYEPLIQANREFLILSQSITGNASSPRLRSKQELVPGFYYLLSRFRVLREGQNKITKA